MKKRVLFSIVALLCSLCSFAQHQDGEYVYTSSARYKLVGSNLLDPETGTFSKDDGFGGWALIDGSEDYTNFAEKNGDGIMWTNSLATNGIVATMDVTPGSDYIVMFKMYNDDNSFVTTPTAGSKNRVQIIANSEGGETIVSGEGVASETSSNTMNIGTEPDVEYSIVVSVANSWNTKLNIVLAGLLENTHITNIEVWQAQQVWDIRKLNKSIEYANTILEMDEFKANEAAYNEFVNETFNYILDLITNQPELFDEESMGEDVMKMLDEASKAYLDATALNVNDLFKTTIGNTTYTGFDFANWPTYSRGAINATGPNTAFQSGNWGHLLSGAADPAALTTRIQTGYNHNAAINIYHKDFPGGKYFLSLEVRSATVDKTSWPCNATFGNSSMFQYFINNEVLQGETSGNSDFTRVYMISETPDEEFFHAGVFWGGVNSDGTMEVVPNQTTLNITSGPSTSGGIFEVRNVEVRAFAGESLVDDVNRKGYYSAFKAQYDAIVKAREAAVAMQEDKATYPYGQDYLATEMEKWDVYYNKMMTSGWVNEDGEDTKVATSEELQNFVLFQGVWATPEDTVGVEDYVNYPVSTGYNNAVAYVKGLIAHFTTLAQTIGIAQGTRDDGMNINGDKETLTDAINAAQSIYDATYAAADPTTFVADSTNIMSANETLLAAIDAFKESAKLETFLEFSFDTDAEGNAVYNTIYGEEDFETGEATIAGYEIPATKGDFVMTFASAGSFGSSGAVYQLGSDGLNDVLRIGGSEATIDFSSAEITADECLRVEFDYWFGSLSKKLSGGGVKNAEDDRLGGFYYSPYNNIGTGSWYNDFGVYENGTSFVAGSGFNIGATARLGNSSTENAKIHADGALNHFVLVYDAKAQTIVGEFYSKGSATPTSGDISKCAPLPMPQNASEDFIPAKFYLVSDYNNTGRRGWFDNLKMYRYKSSAEVTGIREVSTQATKTVNNNTYNVAGQVVSDNFKGIVIQNGKKFIK